MLKRTPTTLVLLLASATAFTGPLRAQDQEEAATEEPAAPTQGEQAFQLVSELEGTHGEMVSLVGAVADAQGEDRLLIRAQIDDLATAQHKTLSALVELLGNQDALGTRAKVIEQRTAQALRRSSRLLRSYILDLTADLETEVVKRSDLSSSDLQVFEHGIAEATHRLDRYYLGLIQLTDTMLAFGLDIEQEKDFLAQQLSARGQNLLRLLELTGNQLAEYKVLIKKTPEDGDLQARVFAAEERFDSNKTALYTTIQMMKNQGLDFTDLEVRTLEITGELTPEALQVEVVVGLLGRSWDRATAFLADNGPKILVRILSVLGILAIFWIVARLSKRAVSKILDKTKIATSTLLKEMVISMVGRVVMVVGIIVVLSQMGINLGPILAGFGIAGFIIGFALQDTLSNFAAGAMILAYRPYDVGDVVEAAGITGKVRDMNLVSTRILTLDYQTLIVPNSKIWGDVIRNVTAQPRRRVDMVFGISYEDEIPKAEQVLLEILRGHDRVLEDPEPVVKVHTLNDSSVDFVVRPWAATDDYWDVYWDITREVKMRFDKEGISIPYPQRDVHLIAQSAAQEPPPES